MAASIPDEAFARWATRQTGRAVSLPTEAQWEYAARGPQNPTYPWGEGCNSTRLNYGDVSLARSGFTHWTCADDDDGYARTAPVGSYRDGASWCGAFDMAGNVREWVQDKYDSRYYAASPAVDPPGPTNGDQRALRGGGWSHGRGDCRAARRYASFPDERFTDLGFRVVVSAPAGSASRR